MNTGNALDPSRTVINHAGARRTSADAYRWHFVARKDKNGRDLLGKNTIAPPALTLDCAAWRVFSYSFNRPLYAMIELYE